VDAGRKLAESYLEMRRSGLNHRTISATPRQLESLIRMSEAFAKMRLSSEVVEEDVEMAIALIQKATLAAATDPATGRIDMDIINTGRSDGIRKKTGELAEKMKEFMLANTAKYRKTNTVDKFIEEFGSFGSNYRLEISKEQIIEAFKALQSDDVLSLFGQNKSNPQFKLQIITDFD
jgi:DNA replication licensing factor MCM4